MMKQERKSEKEADYVCEEEWVRDLEKQAVRHTDEDERDSEKARGGCMRIEESNWRSAIMEEKHNNNNKVKNN